MMHYKSGGKLMSTQIFARSEWALGFLIEFSGISKLLLDAT